MSIPQPPVWQCIPTIVRLSALIFLYIHHLKRIFLSGHPDSLLYIQFCRTHTLYLSFISITNQMDPHISFLLIFPSLPILPPHAVSLSLSPSSPFPPPLLIRRRVAPGGSRSTVAGPSGARSSTAASGRARGAQPRPPAARAALGCGPWWRARGLC